MDGYWVGHAFLYPETQQTHRQNVIFYELCTSNCNHHPAAFCLFYFLFLKADLLLQNEHLNARQFFFVDIETVKPSFHLVAHDRRIAGIIQA